MIALASVDSAVAGLMPLTGVNDPGGAIPSTPFCTCTWTTLPSASAAKKTARPVPSGDLVMSDVARAGAVMPCVEDALRFVSSPANTPPATGSGGPLNGWPPGSITVMVPYGRSANGALANQGRPKALLNEMPRGRLTASSSRVAADGLKTLFSNPGLFAVKSLR